MMPASSVSLDRIGVARLAVVGDDLGAVVFLLGHQSALMPARFIAALHLGARRHRSLPPAAGAPPACNAQQRDAAYFTGAGLGSQNMASCSGISLSCSSRARSKSPSQAGILEFGAQLGRDIGRHRNAAMAAMGHVAQRRAVLARDQPPVLAAGAAARAMGRIRLAVASFTPMMFGMLGQAAPWSPPRSRRWRGRECCRAGWECPPLRRWP